MTTSIPEESRLVSVLKYLANNKEEKHTKFLLGAIMTAGEYAFTRKNEYGHFTASAFIVNKDMTNVLLIKHLKHDMWLIPGGHIDGNETALSASIRETEEEVGIKISDLTLLDYNILDIDVHRIPEDVRKCEPSHFHYDVRYLFKLNEAEESIILNKNEATEFHWMPINDILNNENHILFNITKKANNLLTKKIKKD